VEQYFFLLAEVPFYIWVWN